MTRKWIKLSIVFLLLPALVLTLLPTAVYADNPTFTQRTGAANPFDGVDVGTISAPAFVDINNDGKFDAFIGEFGGTIKYYENTGTAASPIFTERTGAANPFDGVDVGDRSNPTFVDINNDGDFDAFIGEYDGIINYYENTGTAANPTFTERTGAANPFNGRDVGGLSTPTFVDIDNDGDFDAFSGEGNGSIIYYENAGTAASPAFTQQAGGGNPFDGVDVGFNSAPAFADINNDGDFDAFIGSYSGPLYYYENTGTATSPAFIERTGAANPFNGVNVGIISTPAFVDINNDGDFDAFIGEYDGVINYYENVDTTPPTLTTVTIASNNGNSSTLAKVGDNVTLTIVANENLTTPTVTIGGSAATVSAGSDAAHWTATRAMTSGDSTGTVSFNIAFSDLASNAGTAVTAVTSGSAVTFDKTAPTAAITYSTAGPYKSAVSVNITATFNEAMVDSPAPRIAISGNNTLSATNMTKTDATHYYYVFTVGSGDGTATVSLSTGTDLAGNVITAAPTSGATFTVDNTVPTLTTVTIASNNANTALANVGDNVTLTIVASENLTTPTVTIGGSAATVSAGSDAAHWTATRAMTSGDSTGTVSFSIAFSDLAGNAGTAVTAVTSGSNVTFVYEILVGVAVYPADKLALLAPWLVLAVILALAIGGSLFAIRRRRAH